MYRLIYKENPVANPAMESVLKVIALKPAPGRANRTIKTAHMSPLANVVSEAENLARMSVVPGFTSLRDVRVMRGRLPAPFIQAWTDWQSNGNRSHFPHPDDRKSFADDQLWAVIEMEHAGTDLEKLRLRTNLQIWDVFWGVAIALAKAEVAFRFEVSVRLLFPGPSLKDCCSIEICTWATSACDTAGPASSISSRRIDNDSAAARAPSSDCRS